MRGGKKAGRDVGEDGGEYHYTRSKQKLLHSSCYDLRLICFQHLVICFFILRAAPRVGAFTMPFATLLAGLLTGFCYLAC